MNAPKFDAEQILNMMAHLLNDYFDPPAEEEAAGAERPALQPVQGALSFNDTVTKEAKEEVKPVMPQMPDLTGTEPKQLNVQLSPELYQKMVWLTENVSRQFFFDYVGQGETLRNQRVSFQAIMRNGVERFVNELIAELQKSSS